MQPEIQVTLKGATLTEIATQARLLADLAGGTTEAAAPVTKRGRKAKTETTAVEVNDYSFDSSDEETTEDVETTESFDEVETDEVVEETPKKRAKAKKLTDADVNDAAMAHAKKHGREKTLKVLKKFGVKSILELDQDQYAEVVKALAV